MFQLLTTRFFVGIGGKVRGLISPSYTTPRIRSIAVKGRDKDTKGKRLNRLLSLGEKSLKSRNWVEFFFPEIRREQSSWFLSSRQDEGFWKAKK